MQAFDNDKALRDIAQAMGYANTDAIPTPVWCALIDALTAAELRGYTRGLDEGMRIMGFKPCQ
jgi:hypothetical protein